MATEYTPKYNLAKPLVNGPETENTWGFDLNLNFDKIDAAIAAQIDNTEIGEIIDDHVSQLIRPGPNISTVYNDDAGTITITGLMGLEQVQDIVGALIRPGEHIDVVYDDTNGMLTIAATGLIGPEEVEDIIAQTVAAGANTAVSYDDALGKVFISTAPSGVIGGSLGNVFDTRLAAQLATIGPGTKTLHLNGYDFEGDACQILSLKRVNAMPTLHTGWIRTVDRYTANGIEDATNGGYWEYIVPSEGIRIEWFGGKAAGAGFDNIPAFNRAKACVTNNTNTTVYKYYRGGPTILFGFPATGVSASGINEGSYYFDSTMELSDRTCNVRGIAEQGVENNYGNPVDLYFKRDVVGINIQGHTLASGSLTEPGGHGSVVENLTINSYNIGNIMGTNIQAHGILMSAKATVRNCRVTGFAGHGVSVAADVHGRAGSQASLWRLDNVWSVANKRCGFFVGGGDVNVGLGTHLNPINNGEWGIWDDGFLGNTWIACHTRGNKAGSFNLQGLTAPSVMIGCYSEGGQPPAVVNGRCISIGGLNYETGIIPQGTGAEVQGHRWRGGMEIQPPGHSHEKGHDDVHFLLRPQDNHIIRIAHGVSGYPHNYYYERTTGTYRTSFANLAGWEGYTMTADNCVFSGGKSVTGNVYPGEIEPNSIIFAKGVYLSSPYGGGNLGNERLISSNTGPPTTGGMHARGEVVFNRNPTAGGPVGWVCTTGGGASSLAAWVSGTNYNLNAFTGVNYSTHVHHLGRYYRVVVDPNLYEHNPEPANTANFTLTATKSVIRNTLSEGVVFKIAMTKYPLVTGRTASVSLQPSPSQTAIDGVDYTPSLQTALDSAVLPAGVTRSGSTLTFDSAYVGGIINLSITTVVKDPNNTIETIIPHLHTPTITGGSGATPTVGIWQNDPLVNVSDFTHNFIVTADRPTLNEDGAGTQTETIYSVTLMHQPMNMGTICSVDIGPAPGMSAEDGVDYTPSISGAIAAATLPAGVTRVGNRISFSPPTSPPGTIPPFQFKLVRVNDAEIEGLETVIVRLSNPSITGALQGRTVGIALNDAVVRMTETIVSTVPPTHAVAGDVHYPEPDPLNPGQFVKGYHVALSRRDAFGLVAVRQQLS